ncbi:MAG: OB-fold domain-containing protein [Casimicrobiaceae bacterium]
MSYLPAGTPLPQPVPDDQPYWDFVSRRDLRIQRCADCERFRHPPMPFCPGCRSSRVEWAKVPGSGTVYSYTIVHHPAHPALEDALPYNVAVVHLDEAGDVRLVSNVIDAAPEEMAIGLRVMLCWDDTAEGVPLPRFRKAA